MLELEVAEIPDDRPGILPRDKGLRSLKVTDKSLLTLGAMAKADPLAMPMAPKVVKALVRVTINVTKVTAMAM